MRNQHEEQADQVVQAGDAALPEQFRVPVSFHFSSSKSSLSNALARRGTGSRYDWRVWRTDKLSTCSEPYQLLGESHAHLEPHALSSVTDATALTPCDGHLPMQPMPNSSDPA